jgi:hypothetical protein
MKIPHELAFKYVTVLEFVVSIIFLVIGHLLGNAYFRGVGIGLVISWVTGALAILITKENKTK